MGGILSAEVVLLSDGMGPQHRIVGTINFDTPFLGMHPGIIGSGIGSLFRPASTPGGNPIRAGDQDTGHGPAAFQSPAASSTKLHGHTDTPVPTISPSFNLTPTQSYPPDTGTLSPSMPPVNDPNYNPPFPNDIQMATRSGWSNALHFINKYSDNLTKASKSYVTSYFEFGGCLADYNGLKQRYSRLRSLETADSRCRHNQPRVRFVNYYTASTGRPRKPQPPSRKKEIAASTNESKKESPIELETEALSLSDSQKSISNSNFAAQEDANADDEIPVNVSETGKEPFYETDRSKAFQNEVITNPANAADITPTPDTQHINLNSKNSNAANSKSLDSESSAAPEETVDDSASDPKVHRHPTEESLHFPPIPDPPPKPAPFDPSLYPEKDIRKLAEKEYSRQVKAYEHEVKDIDKAVKARQDLVEKREQAFRKDEEKQAKRKAKEQQKQLRLEQKRRAQAEKDSAKAQEVEVDPDAAPAEDGVAKEEKEKPKKDKKFCLLPSKIKGEVDPCWVRVYMRDVDEVGAHCGLFFVNEHYEWLVNDVARRVVDWVGGGT